MRNREDIVAAARACVGARFRAHGRDPEHGLDCAGVVAIAFGIEIAAAYPLRGGHPADIAAGAAAAGLARIEPADAGDGDLLLLAAGPGQLHLAILTTAGFVHADAGLRRVVETPGRPRWPVLAAWRGGE